MTPTTLISFRRFFAATFLAFSFATFTVAAESNVLVHPLLPGMPASPDFTIEADGQPVGCYRAEVFDGEFGTPAPANDHNGPFAQFNHVSFAAFDLRGPVTIRVKSRMPVQRATLRPLALGLVTRIEGNDIVFTLNRPQKITLEINGSYLHALHLFAGAPENNPPSPTAPGVRYFAPGLHELEDLPLHSGDRVYLAPGALLRFMPAPRPNPTDTVNATDLRDIVIFGHGVIDSSLLARNQRNALLHFDRCRNVTVRGVTLLDSAGWNFRIEHCQDIVVDDVRIIAHRINADGVDVSDSQHVRVNDCFVRAPDDCAAVKSHDASVVTEDIVYTNLVVWNDQGWALGPTYESTGEIRHVVYRDCTVLHSTYRDNRLCVIGVYLTGPGHVHDIVFDRITIERAKHPVLGLKIECEPWAHGRNGRVHAPWKREQSLGHISDIVFRDIRVFPQAVPSWQQIFGSGPQLFGSHFTAGALVENVAFENLTVGGQRVTDPEEWGLQIASDTVRGVRFAPLP